jgi:hypothetical protein
MEKKWIMIGLGVAIVAGAILLEVFTAGIGTPLMILMIVAGLGLITAGFA